MLQGLYRNMCLLCVQLVKQPVNHLNFLSAPTPFNFLVKIGNPQGPLWQNQIGPHAALSCLMMLGGANPQLHPKLLKLGYLPALVQLFHQLFTEDMGNVTKFPMDGDRGAGPADGIPVPFQFERLDLRLLWARAAAALVCEDPMKVLLTCREVLDQLVDAMCVFALEYRFQSEHLSVVLEVFPRVIKALMTLYTFPTFEPVRQPFIFMLVTVLCRAISPNHREQACNALTEMCEGDAYMCQEVCAILLQSSFNYVCAQIICGPSQLLSVAVAKLLAQMGKLGGHGVRLYLNEEVLVHMLPVMMDPQTTAVLVLQLARAFYALTTDLSIGILGPLLDLSNLTPFIGLCNSTHENRRDLIKDWLEFFGMPFSEAGEILSMCHISTELAITYIATKTSLPKERAEQFRHIVFDVIQDRFHQSRTSADPTRAERIMNEQHLCQLVEMCDLQEDCTEGFCKLVHTLILNPPTSEDAQAAPHQQTPEQRQRFTDLGFLQQFWQSGKLPWFVHLLQKVEVQTGVVDEEFKGSNPRFETPSRWTHVQLFRVHAIVLRVCAALVGSFREVTEVLITQAKLLRTQLTFLTRYCHEPIPLLPADVRTTGGAKGDSEAVYDAALCALYRLTSRLAVAGDHHLKMLMLDYGALEYFTCLMVPNPRQQAVLREQLANREELVLPEAKAEEGTVYLGEAFIAKKIAGLALAAIMVSPDARKVLQSKELQYMTEAMVLQLVAWKRRLTDFEAIAARNAAEKTIEDRCFFLYLVLLSRVTIEWMLDRLKLRLTAELQKLLIRAWRYHNLQVITHLCMRMVGTMASMKGLWMDALADDATAELIHGAVMRTLASCEDGGNPQAVREIRHVVRYFVTSVSHVLDITVLGKDLQILINKVLRIDPDGAPLKELEDQGGVLLANRNCAQVVLLEPVINRLFEELLELPEEDVFCQSWSLWLTMTFMAKSTPEAVREKPGTILQLVDVNLEQRLRRAQFTSTTVREELDPIVAETSWIGAGKDDKLDLARNVVKVLCKAVAYPGELPQRFSCLLACWILSRVPRVLPVFVDQFLPKSVDACFALPYPQVHAAVLLMVSVLVSLRVPVSGPTTQDHFLNRFWAMQASLLQSFANFGEAAMANVKLVPHPTAKGASLPSDVSYSLVFRFFYFTQSDPKLGPLIRSAAAFVLGQCLKPPTKQPPTLATEPVVEPGQIPPPPVGSCPEPPFELVELLANTALDMEQELREKEVRYIFSTAHCHILYALSLAVCHHPKASSFSVSARGAALAQMLKVQRVLAADTQPSALLDDDDGDDALLWMFIRSAACIRTALQSVLNGWLHSGFGSRFAATEEGGIELLQFCIKHVLHAYNGKTKLRRAMGNKWDTVMVNLGPTPLVVQLFLSVCGAEQNLRTLSKLGGEKAIHNLSRYGDDNKVRQQATILLTKLAVLNAKG